MTHFLPFKTHIFLSAVIAAGFLVRSALAADATQTITMDISAGEAPACVTATTGITTVTLNLINLPNGLAKLNVNSYLIPEPDADKLPGGKRSAPPTTQTFIYTIDSSHYYIFTLTYPDSEGTTKKMKWKCGFDDTLSLSVGPLFTEIPYRTYTAQNVPTVSGTQNLLIVGNNGHWTPQGVGLLNYKLFNSDAGTQLGLSLSTGPVFKFGGTPGVSNFGWFGGVSISIWHRLFLTPGLHIGQFADYPAGFGNNTPVPASFGALTPETRWTGRFAFAITYRTNSLVKSSSGSSPASQTGTPAPAAATPKPGGQL